MAFYTRTEMLLGEDAIKRLSKKRVAVFGIGGVGGFAAEALARAGIGYLDLFDDDVVSSSNINRQIIALNSTIAQFKCDIMHERILDINKECIVKTHKVFYNPLVIDEFPFEQYDYVIDAVDVIASKLTIIEQAKKANVAIISAMGAGNKLHPEKFEIADISKTSVCPLARIIRKQLKAKNIKHVKVVYSKEKPLVPIPPTQAEQKDDKVAVRPGIAKNQTPGSISFVPGTVGLILAGAVIRDLLEID